MIKERYDYLLVGGGLFNGVFAYHAIKSGKTCLVVERREELGGNVRCEEMEGINVHKYGAHIFHTSDERVWSFVNGFCEFNRYTNSPIANYKGEIYNMPFNMNTFNKMWGVVTPAEAREKIAAQRAKAAKDPKNLEEQAISLVGEDIYRKLIKGYTEKQWGRDCKDLPAFIIKRIPVRYIYDNNYFNDRFQGIPIGGYNKLIERLYEGCDVMCGCDFLKNREELMHAANKVIYTGALDEFFDHSEGELAYRSLRFETEVLDTEDFQGNAVVNYTDRETPYTRIIEHKHFEFGTQPKTVITKEYPAEFESGMEKYYPVNDDANQAIYERYRQKAEKLNEEREDGSPEVVFGGRLGEYKYYDMDKVIASALTLCDKEFGR